jgi:tRNA threonylcarbamoyladenosine biosynthesis protein TsaB
MPHENSVSCYERGVRVLGIETSSRRGTVALVEAGRVIVSAATEAPGGHAPHLLGMVDQVLANAGWSKAALDRIGVGVGPGSFTGIRVGIALAQGIALGLARPVVGVGSLCAMSRAAPAELRGPRCAFIDARRNEVFGAEYDEVGRERRAAQAIRREDVGTWLGEVTSPVVLGEVASSLALAVGPFRSDLTDLPHAGGVALIAEEAPDPLESRGPVEAVYVRPADAIRPNLPGFPLSSSEPT